MIKIAGAMLLLLVMSGVAESALSPRAYVKELAGLALGAMQDAASVDASKEFAARFDMSRFSKRCLIDHWERLTDEQRELFIGVFSQVLSKRLHSIMGDRLKGKEFTYDIERERRGQDGSIVVPMKVHVKDVDISFVYSLVRTVDGFKLIDYEVAGALLSRNYRGHFNYLMRKYGFAGMLDRMRQKL